MRKILFLDQGEFLGGAEMFLLDFFKSLNSAEKRMLNISVLGAEEVNYQKKLTDLGINRIEFDYPIVKGGKFKKALASSKFLMAAFALRKIIKQEGFTVLFSNTPRTHFLCFVAKKLGIIKTSWIAYFHDFTVRPSFLVKAIGAKADTLIANSIPTRNFLYKNIRQQDVSKIKIIENGISFKALEQTPKPPRSITNVLCLGRIDPRKGQKYVVEAADLLLERNPELTFTIVGDSVKSDKNTLVYEKEIQDFVRKRKLKTVKFEPFVSNPLKEIAKYDLVIFPSTEPETFGRVVIEALVLNKLVLAFDVTGPKDILKSFKNYLSIKGVKLPEMGLLVERNNSMSLAEHIGDMADNTYEYKKVSESGYDFVKKYFDLEETKKQMIENLMESQDSGMINLS